MPKKNKRVVVTMEFDSPMGANEIKKHLKSNFWIQDGVGTNHRPKQVQVNLIKDDSVTPPVALAGS